MIAIVDYGLGNIRAFANVFKTIRVEHCIAKVKADLKGATKIILPGVGAFDHAMERLSSSGMREPLEELVVHQKIPVMGICVGMQILGKCSAEGQLPGLGWVNGRVVSMREEGLHMNGVLPHMGWNQVRPMHGCKLFEGLGEEPEFYFLHSYCFQTDDPSIIAAESDYGATFPSAVQTGHVYGVQFHPEKSHQNGVSLLRNFAEIQSC